LQLPLPLSLSSLLPCFILPVSEAADVGVRRAYRAHSSLPPSLALRIRDVFFVLFVIGFVGGHVSLFTACVVYYIVQRGIGKGRGVEWGR